MTGTDVHSADFLIEFIHYYNMRNPNLSSTLINVDNQEVGYRIIFSENNFSDIKSFLLEEYAHDKDDPTVVTVTPLQLEIILDYVTVSVLNN